MEILCLKKTHQTNKIRQFRKIERFLFCLKALQMSLADYINETSTITSSEAVWRGTIQVWRANKSNLFCAFFYSFLCSIFSSLKRYWWTLWWTQQRQQLKRFFRHQSLFLHREKQKKKKIILKLHWLTRLWLNHRIKTSSAASSDRDVWCFEGRHTKCAAS